MRVAGGDIMEIVMSVKVISTLAAAVLLGTTALASAAQAPSRHQRAAVATQDPFAGTYFEGVVPYGSEQMPNPYAGTVFDGVAPY
jgi:hypothetical protein